MKSINKLSIGEKEYAVEDSTLRESISNKQNPTDNNLETTSKSIVGAINEFKTKYPTWC